MTDLQKIIRARIVDIDTQIAKLNTEREACAVLLNGHAPKLATLDSGKAMRDEPKAAPAGAVVQKRRAPRKDPRPFIKKTPRDGSIISIVVDDVKSHPWARSPDVAARLGMNRTEAGMTLSQAYSSGYLTRRAINGGGRGARYEYKVRYAREIAKEPLVEPEAAQ